MATIIHDDVVNAVTRFLDDQLQAKLEPLQKKLNKAKSDQVQKIEDDIAILQERFTNTVWLKQAATKMAKQLRFGTHISKGVHPDSKGDNINFRPSHSLPTGIVGFQNIAEPKLDANSSSAALPLAAFFNYEVNGGKLQELILSDHPALDGAFDRDFDISRRYQKIFKDALAGVVDAPSSDGFNKQLLWPIEDAIANDDYHCLIPLYPSALTHDVFNTIQDRRYSEQNQMAKTNRGKKGVKQAEYISYSSLAVISIGGSNPQNVSLLAAKQRAGTKKGANFLLESLPPTYSQQHEFSLSKRQDNFFNKNLAYHCYQGLQILYATVEAPKNVTNVRDQRKQALDLILGQVLQAAAYIQQHYPPGWSESYQLKMSQKFWLDPQRAKQEQQATFKHGRESSEWVSEFMQDFSRWLNSQLKTKFKKRSTDFDDAEQQEWFREAKSAVKASIRAQEGIF